MHYIYIYILHVYVYDIWTCVWFHVHYCIHYIALRYGNDIALYHTTLHCIALHFHSIAYTNKHTCVHTYINYNIYIYIYGRGRRFPERTSIRIIELEEKQCFTVVKWTFFIFSFHCWCRLITDQFFFRPSKLKSSSDHHKLFFLVFLFSPLELRGAFFVLYQRSLEEGIIYCVSTGIWCDVVFHW